MRAADAQSSSNPPGWRPACGAALLLVGWYAALTAFRPQLIADEQYHYKAIVGLANGQWPHPQALSVLPGYHLPVSLWLRLSGPSLAAARAASLAMSIGAVFLLWDILRRRSGGANSWELYAIVASPLFLPVSALVYTEPAAILLLVAALRCASRGRLWGAAAALTLAFIARQSSALWTPLFLAMAWRRGEARRALAPFLAAAAAMGLILWRSHEVTFDVTGSNELRFNPAQATLFAATCAILWAPLWINQWRHERRLACAWLARGLIVAGWVGLAGALALLYDNPHPWNSDPNYLRNRFLLALHASEPLRLILGATVLAAATAIYRFSRRQPDRAWLALTWICSAVYLAPHWLVEPRYFIPVMIFLQCAMRLPAPAARRLAIWQMCLTLGLAAYMLRNATAAGGVL